MASKQEPNGKVNCHYKEPGRPTFGVPNLYPGALSDKVL